MRHLTVILNQAPDLVEEGTAAATEVGRTAGYNNLAVLLLGALIYWGYKEMT